MKSFTLSEFRFPVPPKIDVDSHGLREPFDVKKGLLAGRVGTYSTDGRGPAVTLLPALSVSPAITGY